MVRFTVAINARIKEYTYGRYNKTMQALHDYDMEKIVDLHEYKYINKSKRTYTYQEAVDLAHSIAAKEIEEQKKTRKAQFWDSMFISVSMASVFLFFWFALLLGF